MAEDFSAHFADTYSNPVYERSFPDPFVLKFCGEYFAYCTDFWTDGNVFGVLRSNDLINWSESGGAMKPLEHGPPFYWAPEVTYSNGQFYLYYSCGNETLMEIRVAVSDRPDGGFIDCGKRLTNEDFAIDAHVFTDDDGSRWLFYATDFLEHTHIGTGTVVDRMIDFYTLTGNPRAVTRAKYDWQIYDPNRKEKGGVRWHTVEGPFILKRKSVYYQMFSGGNWQNPSYGVSFAATDDLEHEDEWDQFSDGDKLLPILRTVENSVIGPGHNSVVRGPNNRELYCIYHRWTDAGRVLAIDRMDFAGRRIFVEGPSTAPKPAPFKPSTKGFSENSEWRHGGKWNITDQCAAAKSAEGDDFLFVQTPENFLCEVSFKFAEQTFSESAVGIRFTSAENIICEFVVLPEANLAVFSWREREQLLEKHFSLPDDFRADAFHLLRIEINSRRLQILLEDTSVRLSVPLEQSPDSLSLTSKSAQAEFAGFALSEGFEDLFEHDDIDFKANGWETSDNNSRCRIENGELLVNAEGEIPVVLIKSQPHANYEFAANMRVSRAPAGDSGMGFVLLKKDRSAAATFLLNSLEKTLSILHGGENTIIELPHTVDFDNHNQFQFLKTGSFLTFRIEGNTLYEFYPQVEETQIGLMCRNSEAAFEMVRLTVL